MGLPMVVESCQLVTILCRKSLILRERVLSEMDENEKQQRIEEEFELGFSHKNE